MYFDSSEEVIMDYYIDEQETYERNNKMIKKNELEIQLLIVNKKGKNNSEKIDSEQQDDEEITNNNKLEKADEKKDKKKKKKSSKNINFTAVVEIRKFTLKLKSSEENFFHLKQIEKYPSLIDKKFKKLYELFEPEKINHQSLTNNEINAVIMHTLPTFKWKLTKNYIFVGLFFSEISRWKSHVDFFIDFGIDVRKIYKFNKSISESSIVANTYEKIFIEHKDHQKGKINSINLEQTHNFEISLHTEKIIIVNSIKGILLYSKYEGKDDNTSNTKSFFIEKYIYSLNHKDNISTCKTINQSYISKAYMGSTKKLDKLYLSGGRNEELPQDYLYILLECDNDKNDILTHLFTKMIVLSIFKETDPNLPKNIDLEELQFIKQDRSMILSEINRMIESKFFNCDLNNFYPFDFTDYIIDCKNSGIMRFKFNHENPTWTLDTLTDDLKYKQLISFNYDEVSNASFNNRKNKSVHKITNVMDIINNNNEAKHNTNSKSFPNIFANMFYNIFYSSKIIFNDIQNSVNNNLEYYKLIKTNDKKNKHSGILPKNSAFLILAEWLVIKIYEINSNTLVFN